MSVLVAFLAVGAVLVGYVVLTYNRLIAQIEAIKNGQRQIDVQLDRRYKLFESLIEVLKKYMDYEKTTLVSVTELRSRSVACAQRGDQAGQILAEEAISGVLPRINAQFEAYPDLKANQNALQLQEEIVSTENKLAFSKQAYNDALESYNASKRSFFARFIVALFPGSLDMDFAYWHISDESRARNEGFTVRF